MTTHRVRRWTLAAFMGSGSYELIAVQRKTSDFQPRVVAADFVSMEEGTGIVHIAPAFGDEDLGVGQGARPWTSFSLSTSRVTSSGNYPFAGKFVKDADEGDHRRPRGPVDLLLSPAGSTTTPTPSAGVAIRPLLYYAKTSWYIRTTAVKDRLVPAATGR